MRDEWWTVFHNCREVTAGTCIDLGLELRHAKGGPTISTLSNSRDQLDSQSISIRTFGAMDWIKDKANAAAGGGKSSEKNEDYLDKSPSPCIRSLSSSC